MISIIIPIYNVQDYIIKCLESVSAQTYTGQMECLIVDDCGQDDSILLADKYIRSYQGNITFRIIYREKNGGLSAARNTGLKEAKGEYIGFIDSDDWIEPKMYEELYKKLSVSPKYYFITSCIAAHTDKNIVDKIPGTDNYIEDGTMTPYNFLEMMLCGKTNNSPCNKLYRREFFSVEFQVGRICEDYLFFFDNCSRLIDKDVLFLTTDKTYYHYLVHDGSITNKDSQSEKQWWLDWLENMTYVADNCKDRFPDLYKIQIDSFRSLFNVQFLNILFNKNLTSKRRNTLKNINRYARNTSRRRLSCKTRLLMLIVTNIPYGYGYSLVTKLIYAMKRIKIVVHQE